MGADDTDLLYLSPILAFFEITKHYVNFIHRYYDIRVVELKT